MTRLPRQDQKDRSQKRELEQKGQDMTMRTELPDRAARIDSQHRTARIRQLGQDRSKRTARKGPPD
jgi:hypothetical protein